MKTLAHGFLKSAARHPDRPAVRVGGTSHTYAELDRASARLASALGPAPGRGFTALLAQRSFTACAGMLAILRRGHAYTPLNPGFPASRLASMLSRAGCDAMIVDATGLEVLPALLALVDRPLTLLVPDGGHLDLAAAHPQHTWLDATGSFDATFEMPVREASDPAYLLFTSGSTGEPKGVPVTHGNIRHFVDVMVERYTIGPDDRLSQTFELVFDLSVFDHFCAWEVGACVCVPSRSDLLTPARWLSAEQLTVWFSVPSLALLMQRLRMLRPGFYPHLRLALFCGEALPGAVAEAFAQAAPNAAIENLYGPTEVTLACTLHRWDRARGAEQCRGGLVPIGKAYPGLTARVVDEQLREVAQGERGELLMAGPQVVPGYLADPERTTRSFVVPPGQTEVHYRTGDVVLAEPDGTLHFVGRVDHQVKVHGHRVELGEIEAVAREVGGLPAAVCLPWTFTEAGADTLALVLDRAPPDGLFAAMAERLPGYMVPRELRVVAAFPLNANGKIDRAALRALLERA